MIEMIEMIGWYLEVINDRRVERECFVVCRPTELWNTERGNTANNFTSERELVGILMIENGGNAGR